MAKFKIIHIELYKRDLTIFIGSHDEFKDWITTYEIPESWEQLVEAVLNSDDNSEASYWRNNNNGNGIIELPYHPKSPEEIGVAVHEALHAVMHILNYVNIPLYPGESNEPYTYLLENIVRSILDYNDYELINVE